LTFPVSDQPQQRGSASRRDRAARARDSEPTRSPRRSPGIPPGNYCPARTPGALTRRPIYLPCLRTARYRLFRGVSPCWRHCGCVLAVGRAGAAWARIGRGTWRMAARRGGRWRSQQYGPDCISPGQGSFLQVTGWRPQQDSNLRTRLRRPLLYPLSYGGSDAAREALRASRSQGTSTVGM
jgi:hypothetical protein